MRKVLNEVRIFTGVEYKDKLNLNKPAKFKFTMGKRYIVSYISEFTFIIEDDNGHYLRVEDGNVSFSDITGYRDIQLNRLL